MDAPRESVSGASALRALKAFARPAPAERCELCALEVGPAHPHLISADGRMLRCACVACSLLFDGGDAPAVEAAHTVSVPARADAAEVHAAAAEAHEPAVRAARWRRVTPGARMLRDFALGDGLWESLRIPIGLAYFTASAAGKVRAFYPSPAGATESLLSLDAWAAVLEANPSFEPLQPLTEALLINRMGGKRAAYRVSIDHCFALVGTVRARWRGFTGGAEVWAELEHLFKALEGAHG